MDPNSWFYTLSAIPQTLAATIALAATFVVFKLNFIQQKIRDIRKDLRRFILLLTSYRSKEIHDIEPLSDEGFLKLYEESLRNIKPESVNFGLDQSIYKKLSKEMERIILEEWHSFFRAEDNRNNRIFGYLDIKKNIFENLLKKKENSLKSLGWSLFVATIVIIISLVSLPNYYSLNYIGFNLDIVLAVILAGAAVSVILTSISVWQIAKN
jgi:hypothetical protein